MHENSLEGDSKGENDMDKTREVRNKLFLGRMKSILGGYNKQEEWEELTKSTDS